MINDSYLRLSTDQAPVDSAGSTSYPAGSGGASWSANYIDLLKNRNLGDGLALDAQLLCTAALTTDQTWGVLIQLGATPYATAGITIGSFGYIGGTTSGYNQARKLTVGNKVICRLAPYIGSLGLRYLYATYINHTLTTAVAGRFTIDIVQSLQVPQANLAYSGGFTIT